MRYSQAAVGDDGTLLEKIRLPNDSLDELAEQYAGGEAPIEATGHYRPIYERFDEHVDDGRAVVVQRCPKRPVIIVAVLHVEAFRPAASERTSNRGTHEYCEATWRSLKKASCY